MKSVAVIGASLAGLSAARALRAQGFDGELTIVGDEARRPYDRPPLSKEFLAGDIGEDALALEADDDDLNAEWLLGVHATRLDAAARRRASSTTEPRSTPTASSSPRARGHGTWPGSEGLAGVHVLRTIDDAVALRDDLRPGRAAGGDRRRLHRRRSRLHRNEIGPGRHGGRGRAGTAGRPARRATRRRGGTAAHRARHPAAVRRSGRGPDRQRPGHRRRAGRRASRCPPTSSLSASARSPTSSGCATARLELGQRRRVRRGRRDRSPERGRGRRLCGLARADRRLATPRRTLDGRAGAARDRRRHSARRAARRHRRPNPRTSGPISTAAASSSLASPTRRRDHLRGGQPATTPASWPCTGAKANRSPCSASTNRSCSPAGVANWPFVPRPRR